MSPGPRPGTILDMDATSVGTGVTKTMSTRNEDGWRPEDADGFVSFAELMDGGDMSAPEPTAFDYSTERNGVPQATKYAGPVMATDPARDSLVRLGERPRMHRARTLVPVVKRGAMGGKQAARLKRYNALIAFADEARNLAAGRYGRVSLVNGESSCEPGVITDTLAHGKDSPGCSDCADQTQHAIHYAIPVPSLYATFTRAGETPVSFDRETGEIVSWEKATVSFGGTWRDPSTWQSVRTSYPSPTGERI